VYKTRPYDEAYPKGNIHAFDAE